MNGSAKKVVPAYTTYKSFVNLINDLKENDIPPHVTRSVVKGSNSAKAMMTASLKALDLINEDTVPTDKLSMLVNAGEDYSTTLNLVIQEAYPFLFDGTIDLSNTTTEKVAEKFKEAGATGSTITKCMSFFLSAAKDAEIEVHPRVRAPAIDRSKQTRRKSKQKDQQEEILPLDPGTSDGIDLEGMEKIIITLRGMDDGFICLPEGLEGEEAKRVLKAVVFNLKHYYEVEESIDR